MSRLVVFIFALSTPGLAGTPLEVEELDLGACWFHSSERTAKIASFNDGVTITVSKVALDLPGVLSAPQLNRKISMELRKLGFSSFPTSRYDLFAYCNGLGHTFLVNLHDG